MAAIGGVTNMIKEHKKRCLVVVVLLVVAIILIIVYAHNICGFADWQPLSSAPWSSPDYKLLKKNHTGDTRRSDNKEDTWKRSDFLKSVAEFNKRAADR